jgi:hypothetical protein
MFSLLSDKIKSPGFKHEFIAVDSIEVIQHPFTPSSIEASTTKSKQLKIENKIRILSIYLLS